MKKLRRQIATIALAGAITENHRKMLKDLRTNLDAVKASKNLDTSYSIRVEV